jgi:hypothetical protein
VAALDDEFERCRELAGWLVEVGKRRRSPPAADASAGLVADAPQQQGHSVLPRLLLFVVLAMACLQYFYLDALLEVSSLRRLIVFVFTGADG